MERKGEGLLATKLKHTRFTVYFLKYQLVETKSSFVFTVPVNTYIEERWVSLYLVNINYIQRNKKYIKYLYSERLKLS